MCASHRKLPGLVLLRFVVWCGSCSGHTSEDGHTKAAMSISTLMEMAKPAPKRNVPRFVPSGDNDDDDEKGDDDQQRLNPCRTTQWSSWSNCSQPCGAGVRNRTRNLLTWKYVGFHGCKVPLIDWEACSPGKCGEMCALNGLTTDSAFGAWSNCSSPCGAGYRRRRVLPETESMAIAYDCPVQQDRICFSSDSCVDTRRPTLSPSSSPTASAAPTNAPSATPTNAPSAAPTTSSPSSVPTFAPTFAPTTRSPTPYPSGAPSFAPSLQPSHAPTPGPREERQLEQAAMRAAEQEARLQLQVLCRDGRVSGTETDVDCGGSCNTTCLPGKHCKVGTDCRTRHCGRVPDLMTLKGWKPGCTSIPCTAACGHEFIQGCIPFWTEETRALEQAGDTCRQLIDSGNTSGKAARLASAGCVPYCSYTPQMAAAIARHPCNARCEHEFIHGCLPGWTRKLRSSEKAAHLCRQQIDTGSPLGEMASAGCVPYCSYTKAMAAETVYAYTHVRVAPTAFPTVPHQWVEVGGKWILRQTRMNEAPAVATRYPSGAPTASPSATLAPTYGENFFIPMPPTIAPTSKQQVMATVRNKLLQLVQAEQLRNKDFRITQAMHKGLGSRQDAAAGHVRRRRRHAV